MSICHIRGTYLCCIKDEVRNIEEEDFLHPFSDIAIRQVRFKTKKWFNKKCKMGKSLTLVVAVVRHVTID